MPELPPWLKAADPATHMEAGLRIGVQIGAQQAEERFRQQQLAAHAAQQQQQMDLAQAQMRFRETQSAKQQQMLAGTQALAQQKLGLLASNAAQKHQAMQDYQNALAGGMDQTKAMLQFGPGMSANAPVAAAIRASALANKPVPAWSEVTMPSGLKTLQSSTGGLKQVTEPRPAAIQSIPEGSTFVDADEEAGIPKHWVTPPHAGAIKSLPPGSVYKETANGQPAHWEVPEHAGAVAKVPENATFVPKSEDGPAHWSVPTPDMTPSERSQRLREIRDERKEIIDNGMGAMALMKQSRGKTLSAPEQKALDELGMLDRERSTLLPPVPKAAPGGATAPSSLIKKSKVQLAKEIDRQHPEWTKEQVIKAANDAFSTQR